MARDEQPVYIDNTPGDELKNLDRLDAVLRDRRWVAGVHCVLPRRGLSILHRVLKALHVVKGDIIMYTGVMPTSLFDNIDDVMNARYVLIAIKS